MRLVTKKHLLKQITRSMMMFYLKNSFNETKKKKR